MTHSTQSTGQKGELLARQDLEKRGYEVIATNWRCKFGEVDIVARQGQIMAFIEVRTRQTHANEDAFASITSQKQARMIRAAYTYVQAHQLPEDTQWRIDVMAVTLRAGQPPAIDHVEDALGW